MIGIRTAPKGATSVPIHSVIDLSFLTQTKCIYVKLTRPGDCTSCWVSGVMKKDRVPIVFGELSDEWEEATSTNEITNELISKATPLGRKDVHLYPSPKERRLRLLSPWVTG